MKKTNLAAITVLLFAFLFVSNSTFAQNESKFNRTPEERATKITDRMKQNLSLTDEQYTQVYNMFLTKVRDKMNNKEKYKSMDKESRKQLKKQSRDEMRKQFENILNAEQLTKMKELKEKHKQNRGKNKDGKRKKKDIENN